MESELSAQNRKKTSAEKVQAHRSRMRAKGLRPVQIWVPDTRSADFAKQAKLQARAIAASALDQPDQEFIDAISE
ncbi:MAG: hypothetical protein COA47_03470 [Robiginitomaculum sp.]|nr:MAG: hypothetical protein COA47_03470 [Robiginitomaculum sp.]